MKEFTYPSAGKGSLHAYMWMPEGKPAGIVQLVHGIAEYLPRYEDFAAFLNSKGFLVCGEDHMGHGASIGKGDTQGYFTGGWLAAVKDTHTLYEKMSSEYPDVPYFLLGHSMGSFMVRTFLYTYPETKLSGALVSGTAWQPGIVLAAGKTMCRLQANKLGWDKVSPTLTKMMFGSYCKGFEDVKSPYDWLSSVREVVEKYEKDPLCGFDATIGLSYDMLLGIEMNQKKENLAKMPKSLPVYFYAGDKDPVGADGKGVKRSYAAFKKIGMTDVSLKLYPNGRHEMHNEVNRAEVYEDVLKWIESHK